MPRQKSRPVGAAKILSGVMPHSVQRSSREFIIGRKEMCAPLPAELTTSHYVVEAAGEDRVQEQVSPFFRAPMRIEAEGVMVVEVS
jgi:hypothetical protein